jgi:hypothetical protein
MKKEYTDTQLIEALQEAAGCNLVSDDNGKWAVSTSGTQPIVDTPEGFTETVGIVSFVEPHEWKSTIREALIAFAEDDNEDPPTK